MAAEGETTNVSPTYNRKLGLKFIISNRKGAEANKLYKRGIVNYYTFVR